jgi:DNA-binding beta-propeller fold protein YncE
MRFVPRLPCQLLLSALVLSTYSLGAHAAGEAAANRQLLPTGQYLTPTAAPGSTFTALNPGLPDAPDFTVGQTISEALSPDRKTLLVLTSGYNYVSDAKGAYLPGDSSEYVFVFDVSHGAAVKKQVLRVPNTYVGIAFAPDGKRFVVSGGGDDSLHVFEFASGSWSESSVSPIKLGHTSGLGIAQGPMAQGVAITADGLEAVVANRYNASITVVRLSDGAIVKEIDLRPGKIDASQHGVPGGEYPNSVAIVGNDTAFISSERDRELVVVQLATGSITARIPVGGNPNKMILNRSQHLLFVAVDNADTVVAVDTASAKVVDTIATVAPRGVLEHKAQYHGASPNGLTLSADENTLYVTNRGTNSVAVVERGERGGKVVGLIPTGWYPSDVAIGANRTMYIVNTQSVPGPNPGNCLGYQTVPCPVAGTPVSFAPNQYILNLAKGGFLSVPVPDHEALEALTEQVARNNHFRSEDGEADAELMSRLHDKIKHVIYIVKENRTYDQVLGDSGRGNSDPALAEFPLATTPNLHALASQFVQLDNFYDPGNVSGNGWPWTTSGRESDAGAKMLPVNYAGRGGSYDWEGTNANINIGVSGAARVAVDPLSYYLTGGDPDVLPGTGNVAAPDGPAGEVQQGYLWDAALRAGLSVRNYGFFIDLTYYSPATGPFLVPLVRDPATAGVTVAHASNPQLAGLTDGYFRGFDDAFPDFYREAEWEREFSQFKAGHNLPALSLVRLMNDHTGSYARAIDGVNTPEIQVADNDYAVGRLVEAVAHSEYAKDTLIFIVEDDAQDGPDHVDAHRSTAFVVGPYVRQGALVSQHFTTVNMLRTITDVLGLDHLGLFDATQRPMSALFDLEQADWTFQARPSGLLNAAGVTLPIPAEARKLAGAALKPTHASRYWTARTASMDFDEEDKVDAAAYNRILWKGLMGKRPYPARSGRDLGTSSKARHEHAAAVPAKVSAN